ncbi:SET domain-containing protein [Lindgomyces ingoldianus]|uniref:SET domain-containing protein n=1 Tax=Lindgomyces ingoldianus TaxID=673940 RepID=A0ACB6QAK0_9PLEO|nr:SET domain-containing protein [Lindgomyces ingoldianus]KAF2463540.1 SET domain-containing protein [Lindgomyces ingoldianus]
MLYDLILIQVHLGDLRIDSRDPSTLILVKSITPPYIYSSTIIIVEDEAGDVARLTVCNLEHTMIDPLISEGDILAIKQPCWSRLLDGGYHIRVDHPSDLVQLQPNDDLVNEGWRISEDMELGKDATEWKKEGDMMFLKKRFRKALKCYDHGLRYLSTHPSSASSIDLYRKKCGVNIVLLRLDAAAEDLSLAISLYALSNPSLTTSPLVNPSIIESWLHSHSTSDPLNISALVSHPLRSLAARIKFDLGIFQTTATYNLPLISSYVGPLTLHVDAATYISDTEVRKTALHGRGLFAKRAFQTGELICVEKGFVLPGYFINDRSSDCLLYNLGNGTAAPRPGALLFKELVQKLKWNRSLRREFFELDDGGYGDEQGVGNGEGDEDWMVDVFRIERIRTLNCFSVPTRSLDLLSPTYNPHSNPEMRNGFWIHASYINHSCLPNSVRTFIGDVHILRATKPIAPGEEITHQYISPDIDIMERQEKFKVTWGFECDCRLCEIDGGIGEEVRRQRVLLFEELKAAVMKLGGQGPLTITAVKKIARMTGRLEADGEKDLYATLPRLALVHPTLFLTEAWRGVKNVDKMIESSRKLLRNFGLLTVVEGDRFEVSSNAGLVNVEAVRALKYLAEGYTAKGQPTLAEKCREIARLWFLVITGAEVGMEEFMKQ